MVILRDYTIYPNMKNLLLLGLIAILSLSVSPGQQDDPRILVFSKTESFRHSSIETGIAGIQDIGQQHGFAVDASEDASLFTMNNLNRYLGGIRYAMGLGGNEPPEVDIDLLGCNRTFYFPDVPIEYSIRVNDLEDGSLLEGTIPESQVTVSVDYFRRGFDPVEIAQGHRSTDASLLHAAGKELVEAGTCLSCHQLDGPSIGPSYMDVAKKYDGEQDALSYLAGKIREGGSGVWGEVVMPPHVQLSEDEVDQMAAYILSLAKESEAAPSMPIEGTYLPPETTKEGVIVLRAAYTDKGANGLPGTRSEETLVLRNATLDVSTGELSEGVMKFSGPQFPGELTIAMASGTYAKLPDIDLTSVAGIRFTAMVPPQLQGRGGLIEVRLDSPDGPVIGKTGLIDKMSPTQYETVIESATGQYDLYFVFKNKEPGEGGLFVVTTAEFISTQAEHENH